MMATWTRRGFVALGASALLAALAGCGSGAAGRAGGGSTSASASGSDSGSGSASQGSAVVGGVETDSTSWPDLQAAAHTVEEGGSMISDDGLRERVRMDLPDWSGVDFAHVSPDPGASEGTVLSAQVDATRSQQLFLWEEGSAPCDQGEGAGAGHDPAGFRPTVTSVPAAAGTQVRGAVLLCAGGAFAIRGDNSDCYPTANALSARGYQCFVVDYRVHPYVQAESGLDLARAIRFVRAHWRDYGLPSERHIAIGGYSAGGILCGEAIMYQGGSHSPQERDSSYVPDELDAVDAGVAACAMVYSFYGRLAWAEKSKRVLRKAALPPTYYCYGTEDPFYDQFEGQVDALRDIGVTVRARVLGGWPHGFGAEGGWVPEFDGFMQEAFAS